MNLILIELASTYLPVVTEHRRRRRGNKGFARRWMFGGEIRFVGQILIDVEMVTHN